MMAAVVPSDSNPRISVDDTALLEASGHVGAARGRSRSPSSLELCSQRLLSDQDRLSPSTMRSCPLQKCLSYPRLQSTKGAEGGQRLADGDGDIDNLSIVGNVGLLRSMSARTVDSLPPHMTHSFGSTDSGSRFLSPCSACAETMGMRVSSCPQMSLTMLPGKPDPVLQPSPRGEPDLKGEVVDDLPVKPTFNFPDIVPEKPSAPDQENANTPPDTTPTDATCTQGAKLSQLRVNHGKNAGLADRTDPLGKPRDSNFNVDAREKCLRWLKSISIDASQ